MFGFISQIQSGALSRYVFAFDKSPSVIDRKDATMQATAPLMEIPISGWDEDACSKIEAASGSDSMWNAPNICATVSSNPPPPLPLAFVVRFVERVMRAVGRQPRFCPPAFPRAVLDDFLLGITGSCQGEKDGEAEGHEMVPHTQAAPSPNRKQNP